MNTIRGILTVILNTVPLDLIYTKPMMHCNAMISCPNPITDANTCVTFSTLAQLAKMNKELYIPFGIARQALWQCFSY